MITSCGFTEQRPRLPKVAYVVRMHCLYAATSREIMNSQDVLQTKSPFEFTAVREVTTAQLYDKAKSSG